MASTFDTIKYAATQLPQYLGDDDDSLAQEFTKLLGSFKASFASSREELEDATQVLCELFEKGWELDQIVQELNKRPTSKIKEICRCAAKVREALVDADRLDDFLNNLKSPPPGPKKTASSKTRSSDKDTPPSSPNFSYADIRQYKEHRQNSQIESWKSEALVEDEGDHANLEAVMLRGLLEECLHTTCGELSYQEFYTQRIELSKDTVIALRGRLGVGKSQLAQYLVCNIISKNEDNIILFVGQRSSAATKEGRQLLQAFKNQRFKRGRKTTGKFYIIIDEPDADHWRWHKGDWEKLYSAAKHYQAKIILLIRDGSNDKELLKYFFVNSSNIVQLQEAHKALSMPTGSKRWIDSKKIPGSLLTELRRLPLFRLAIDNRLWRLSNQTLSSNETLTSCFRNAYALVDYLYVNRLRDKEVHTGANGKISHDEKFYQQCDELFQYVAFKLCENGGVVSWTEGTPDQLNRWSSLIEDGFVENILKISSRKGQQSQNVISGFWYSSFYSYFLVREIRDRLASGRELDEVLPLIIEKSKDLLKYSMLADGLCDLANDVKQKAIQNLRHLNTENKQFAKQTYRDAITYLIDLLKP